MALPPVPHDAVPSWLDELAFTVGPPHLSMGLRALRDEPWLLADEQRAAQLAEKRRLTAERPDDVFVALPGTESVGAQVLELVVGWLRANDLDAPGADPLPAHPLARAGLVVQEDLCVLREHDGAWHLDAASVHQPSHWRPADKLGHALDEVHGPVAHYPEELAGRVQTVHDRLAPGRPLVRRGWSIHEHADLFAPEAPPWSDAATGPDADPTTWTLRSERQTLVALPGGEVLFTIRTQQAPLGVLQARPDRAHDLAANVRSMSPERLAYKHLGPPRATLLRWLDEVAEGGATEAGA